MGRLTRMAILGLCHFIPEPHVGAAVRHLFRVGAVLVGVRDLRLARGRVRGRLGVRGGIDGGVRGSSRGIKCVGGMGGLSGDGDDREDGGKLHLGG